jgi:hypothetical protein
MNQTHTQQDLSAMFTTWNLIANLVESNEIMIGSDCRNDSPGMLITDNVNIVNHRD